MARSFLDTNILLYADDAFDRRKSRLAVDLIADLRLANEAVVSTQVLQEYYVNATTKLKLDPVVARRKVEFFGGFDLVVPSVEMILAAIDLQRLNPLSFWDAMIIQAASSAGCAVLLTEHLQAGRSFAGVRIENPFKD